MELQLEKLNNKLSKRRIDYIEIIGTVNKEGQLKQQFSDVLRYEDDLDYYVSLITAEYSSLFPNIIKDKNDKLYYSTPTNENKRLTFTEGAYEIENINEIIQKRILDYSNPTGPAPIQITLNHGSGRCEITLKPGYKIDFTKDDTFRSILGFETILLLLDQPFTESPKICDLVLSTKIYISLDIAKGCILNGNPSQVVYSSS